MSLPQRTSPSPYFAGYLMAEACGTRWADMAGGRFLYMRPKSPFKSPSAPHQAWLAGVVDRANDQQPYPKVLKYDK